MPDYVHESAAPRPVCGIDEVGRGPWAGPVVAAAVILDPEAIPDGIDDSKRLTPARREALHDEIAATAAIGVGLASVEEIVTMNILQASHLAMRRAIAALGRRPALALVDGALVPPGLPCPGRAIVGGDGLALSIAAASIVAKVTPRPDDGGARATVSRLRVGAQHGLRHARRTPRRCCGLASPHTIGGRWEPVHKMLCEARNDKSLIQLLGLTANRF